VQAHLSAALVVVIVVIRVVVGESLSTRVSWAEAALKRVLLIIGSTHTWEIITNIISIVKQL